jgi:hypothetical protein
MSEKQCVICKQLILQDTEKWVRLTDFDCEIENGEVYYHLECWQERFQITNSERKQEMYRQAMDSIKKISQGFNGGMMAQ